VYYQEWMDKRLTWDASEVEDVTSIYANYEDMWVPDCAMINK